MKAWRVLLFLAAATVAFFSCNIEPVEEPEEEPKEEPKNDPVPLEYIVLDPSTWTLAVGEQVFIESTVGPQNADDKRIKWSSSNEAVAKVDEGTVTALGAGEVLITAEAADGFGAAASCKITVRLFPETLSFPTGQQRDFVIGSEGGSVQLQFKASESWTISAINDRADSWLTFSPKSGDAGECSVTISAAPSDELDDRSATLQLSCGDVTADITVTQKQKDALTLTSSLFELGPEGGAVLVTVKSNVAFSFSVEESAVSWIKYVETKSYDTHTLLFSVLENTAVPSREGHVEITATGFSETVVIYQAGVEPSLVLSQTEYEIEAEGGIIQIDVRSNVDVSMQIPSDVSWIHEGTSQSTNSFELLVDQNPMQEVRSATISFSGGGLEETVTIIQKEDSPWIAFADSEVEYVCLSYWDLNSDGHLSEREAAAVTELGDHFSYLDQVTSFEELRFFTSLTTIPEQAFYMCYRLQSITLPEGISSIGNNAFYACFSLRNLTIPSGVTSIGAGAFTGCDSFSYIEMLPVEPPVTGESFLYKSGKGWIFVPEQSLDAYKASEYWSSVSDRIAIRSVVEASPIINFADPIVKMGCVPDWDRDGDRELSEYEASLVSSLDLYFQGTNITSFNELRFFTGLKGLCKNEFSSCLSLKSIMLPDHLKELPDNVFDTCLSLENIHLPLSLENIGESALEGCNKLQQIKVPERVISIGSDAFSRCSGLQDIEFKSPTPPAAASGFMFKTGACNIYVPESAVGAYKEAEFWKSCSGRITCRGHEPYEFFYKSNDYSADGEVIQLQKASLGRGFDIVLLPDGYTDKDLVPGGPFEESARAFMEQIFVYEPFKTLRERFNVWCVKAVSENSEYGSPKSTRKFTEDAEDGTITTFNSVIRDYGNKVPVAEDNPRKMVVITNVLDSYGRSWSTTAKNSIALILDALDHRPTTINHELGHAIGYLADEYIEYEGKCPDNNQLDKDFNLLGLYGNIDWRNNPATVRWAHLLADPRYGAEGLGIFEGATYSNGVYRSTANSMMRKDYEKGAVFNATCRELIYQQVMRYSEGSGWTFDYEEFVAADAAGRKQAADAYAGADYLNIPRKCAPIKAEEDRFMPDLPPIMADESVSTVSVTPDGRVILGY